MKYYILTALTGMIFFLLISFCAVRAVEKLELPPEETKIKNTVDHWGLAFSDQLRTFNSNFQKYQQKKGIKLESPDYILGVETSLRKTFRNKYWFKGQATDEVELSAGRNESESFQLAVIPSTGFTLKDVTVYASRLTSTVGNETIPASAIKLWRIGFVRTKMPQYPTRYVGEWPDPLIPLGTFNLGGLDLGLIWCEIKVPANTKPGDYAGTISITPSNSRSSLLTIKLHVWDFTLPNRIQFPTICWVNAREPKGAMSQGRYRKLCALFLEHHIDPLNAGGNMDFKILDQNLEFCIERGLMHFQTPNYKDSKTFRPYYEHIKKKGWLNKALLYGARDEPSEEQFRELVIPTTKTVRKEFPGLKVFLATQHYEKLDKGVDIWLTDLSTNFHSWLKAGLPGKQQLWWYFCHMPIQVGMELPLVDAPNMQIDNDAVEHRIIYWMAHHYDVKGIFIYAGNSWPKNLHELPGKRFQLNQQQYPFPLGGMHNGNGFIVYPGAVPTIRMKNLRDGIEDYWYISKVAELSRSHKFKKKAKELLDGINPAIFVDTHYFDRRPESINDYRNKLGEYIEKAQQILDKKSKD